MEKNKIRRTKAVLNAGENWDSSFKQWIRSLSNMDMNEFESNWKIIRGQAKVWWSLLTDSDLYKVERADIKFFEFVTILQLKYKLDRQFAKDEIGRRVAEFESRHEALISTRP